jgi:hypothetical protein
MTNLWPVAAAPWLCASKDEAVSLEPADLFGAILSGGHYTPPRRFGDATYQERLSTGNLHLIRNGELRSRPIDYYASREQDLAWMDESARGAEVRRNAVADELVPSSVQRTYFENPGSLQASDVVTDFDSALRGLSREEVKQAIMYMLSTLGDARYFAGNSRDNAELLLSALRDELGDDPRSDPTLRPTSS